MSHPTDIAVGKNIRMHRLVKGMTQVQVAELLGTSFQQLQKYETGYNRISASKMLDVANILDVPVSCFFEGVEGNTKANGSVFSPDEAKLICAYRQMQASQKASLFNVAKTIAEVGAQ